MKVIVCSRNGAAFLLRKDPNATHVISIRDPDEPEYPEIAGSGRVILELLFHNVEVISDHVVAPSMSDMEAVLAFVSDLAGNHGSLIVHCHGGHNRSPAVALAVVASWAGRMSLPMAIHAFHIENPNVDPNRRIVAAADRLLNLGGLLLTLVETFWPRPQRKAV
jgi:predicted protein tyrosine phosphatase